MDFLTQFPEFVGAQIAATVALMSRLKALLGKQGKSIPPHAKPWIVGGLAGLSTIVAFKAADALSWGNAIEILFVTGLVTFLSILWHKTQKPDPRRH